MITRHESQRGYFAWALLNKMRQQSNIWLICVDLGYKVFDGIMREIPDRFINTGAAEQVALDTAVGLALEGQVPFVYSITPFLLYRPFETIRTYIDHESIPVKLVASGRDKDYAHDGFSHDASDDKKFLGLFPNIKSHWPATKNDVPSIVDLMVNDKAPHYINLSR